MSESVESEMLAEIERMQDVVNNALQSADDAIEKALSSIEEKAQQIISQI